ncbi:hypothetical protein MAPG_11195 [Magnaporthiopsis poae ATCC 64411]|uniref:Acyclic terpene utilisation N-terminal domain-containing protein n=1 Tax=Magnaporthiopsis poae (strain ATCC 64411 / 73-15) TaxID=644358 RepID=A0A0C4EEM1_MAGP6|nr:hypothetical protein MAPG_11195 [Magnaporthiopsis poae ATCC 64411]
MVTTALALHELVLHPIIRSTPATTRNLISGLECGVQPSLTCLGSIHGHHYPDFGEEPKDRIKYHKASLQWFCSPSLTTDGISGCQNVRVMSSPPRPRRPVRIANVSGATGDGPLALHRVVREGPVDVVTADYLAEANLCKPSIRESHPSAP